MTGQQPPQNPAGEFQPPGEYTPERRHQMIEQLEAWPGRLRNAVAKLPENQLDTRYRNWSIRQIVHHLADSHLNSYVRYKWALTESTPEIKSYDETRWSELTDARTAPIHSSLELISGLHHRWGQLMRVMDEPQWARGFFHPELQQVITLQQALPMYVWHGEHHLAQIVWIHKQNGWELAEGTVKTCNS